MRAGQLIFASMLAATTSSYNCSTALPKVFSRDLQVYQCIIRHKTQLESMLAAKIMPYTCIPNEVLQIIYSGVIGLC